MITPSFGLTATERVLPRLALDFTTGVLDSRVTFTRTTGASNPATYVASNGLVTAATNNQARFDYNPATLAIRGLLIEESRANLMLRSEDFASANWNKGGASVTSNSAVSPDGATTADTIVEDTTNATHTVDQAVNVSASTTYTVTFFAKRASGTRNVFIQINTSGGTTGAGFVWFDLGTGAASAITTLGGTFVGVSAAATAFGSSWYRCALTFTTNTGNTGATFYIGTYNGGRSYLGDGTSGIFVWGAQLEAGAFATSYIPTTTTALTRNSDVAVMTGTNFSDWYTATAGSLVFSATARGTNAYVYSFCGAANSGNDALYTYVSTTYKTQSWTGGALQANIDSGVADGASVNISSGYATNNFGTAANGNATQTDLTYTQATMDKLRIGNAPNGVVGGQIYLRKISYYPQRLTNSELQSFSK